MENARARDSGPCEPAQVRLQLLGQRDLADLELLSLVIGGKHALARAMKIHERIGGALPLAQATIAELVEAGATPAQARTLAAGLELGRRLAHAELPWRQPIRGPDDCAAYLRSRFGDETQECFVVIGLDARHRVIHCCTVGKGSLASVDVHPREVFRPLIRNGCHSCIIAHNHPSGEPEPSEADLALTQRLVEVGRVTGIPVLDHLIVTRTRAVSFAALGMISC